jgi:GNAT superfamily N-acetyltransferase
MNIRKATARDVDDVYGVMLELFVPEDKASKKAGLSAIRVRRKDFKTSAKKDLLRAILDKNSLYLVAEDGGDIIGYGYGVVKKEKSPFFVTVPIGYLSAVVVAKNYRGKGVASALHDLLVTWFKKNKCVQIHLEVFEGNPAVPIYEKWGYKTFVRKMGKKV